MFRPDLLHSKRILITGGGTGLGKGMAATLPRTRSRRSTSAAAAKKSSKKPPPNFRAKGPIHAIPCDVRNLDAVEPMIDSIWNEGPLDILVNNAAGNFIARTEELSPRAWNP